MKIFILALSFFCLAACGSSASVEAESQAEPLKAESLEGQNFELIAVGGQPFQNQQAVTLVFRDNLELGGQICNSYHGQGRLQEGRLVVDNMASTRKICPTTGLDELEQAFFQLLAGSCPIELQGSVLTLGEGENAFVFERR